MPKAVASAASIRSPVSAHQVPASPARRGRNQVAPTSGKEADPDLRHGEAAAIARDPVGAMDGHADAAAKRDPVDDRDIRLAVALDDGVEPVFVAPVLQRLVVSAGAPEIIERAQIAAGAERPPAGRRDDNARHRRIALPGGELLRERMHHGMRHRVERAGAI